MSPSIEPFNEAKYKALIDGLKCKEILLSDTFMTTDYFRLEAEYYNSTTVSYRKTLKGKDVALNIQYGTSKYCDEQKDGYPVLRLNELHNAFIDIPQKYCHTLSSDEFEKLRLKNGDVLIIRTNGNPNLVGKSAVVLEDSNYAFASYLYRVNTNEEINPETLVAYLNCKYGRYEIDKNSIKGNQTNFSPAKFRDISIPKFDATLQNTIKNLFYRAYKYRLNADSEFLSAEQMLISSIGFVGFEADSNNVAIKSFSESYAVAGRLDAEYYQTKYDEYAHAVSVYTGGCVKIRDKFQQVKTKCLRNLDEYHYVEIGDINVGNGSSESNIVATDDLPDNAKIMTQKGDLIVSTVRPNRGAVSILEADNLLVSGAFTVLRQNSDYPKEILQVLLRTKIYRDWLLKYNVGTSYPVIKDDDVLNMLIPLFDDKIQNQVIQMIKKSQECRQHSEVLLEYAKQAVEIAIEQGEDKAIKWLKEKGVEY